MALDSKLETKVQTTFNQLINLKLKNKPTLIILNSRIK